MGESDGACSLLPCMRGGEDFHSKEDQPLRGVPVGVDFELDGALELSLELWLELSLELLLELSLELLLKLLLELLLELEGATAADSSLKTMPMTL